MIPISRRSLPLLLAIPCLALSACGSKSDSDKVTDLIKQIDKDQSALCDNATPKLLAQVGGDADKCKAAARGYPNNAHITSDIKVTVNGDRAVAAFTSSDGNVSHPTFVKQDGKWLVASAG